MAKCAVCGTRKGKRNCPAMNGWICSQCCGSRMETGLGCELDCLFLVRFEREMEDLKREEAISNFHYELDSVVADEYFMSVKKEIVSTLTAL